MSDGNERPNNVENRSDNWRRSFFLRVRCDSAEVINGVGTCAADIKAKCGGVQPGDNRLRMCIKENIKTWSAAGPGQAYETFTDLGCLQIQYRKSMRGR